MNKERRAIIQQALTLLHGAKELILKIQEQEQGSFENLTEGLQATERGQRMESNAEVLDEVVDTLDGAIQDLEVIE